MTPAGIAKRLSRACREVTDAGGRIGLAGRPGTTCPLGAALSLAGHQCKQPSANIAAGHLSWVSEGDCEAFMLGFDRDTDTEFVGTKRERALFGWGQLFHKRYCK